MFTGVSAKWMTASKGRSFPGPDATCRSQRARARRRATVPWTIRVNVWRSRIRGTVGLPSISGTSAPVMAARTTRLSRPLRRLDGAGVRDEGAVAGVFDVAEADVFQLDLSVSPLASRVRPVADRG